MKHLIALLLCFLTACSSMKEKKEVQKSSPEVPLEKSVDLVSLFKQNASSKIFESYGDNLLSPRRSPLEFIYIYEIMLDTQACSHYEADQISKKCQNSTECLKNNLTNSLFDACHIVSIQRSEDRVRLYEANDEFEKSRVFFLVGCIDYIETELFGRNKPKNYNSCVCAGLKVQQNPKMNIHDAAKECHNQ